MATSFWFYVGFTAFILAMLALDLGVFHRKAHMVRPKEAGVWVGTWMTLAFAFAAILYFWRGTEPALLFVTGYLIAPGPPMSTSAVGALGGCRYGHVWLLSAQNPEMPYNLAAKFISWRERKVAHGIDYF